MKLLPLNKGEHKPKLDKVLFIHTVIFAMALLMAPLTLAHEGEKHAPVAAPVAPLPDQIKAANRIQVEKVKPPRREVERARAYFTDSTLVTHTGKRVKFYSDMLDNKVVLLNVMYTKCKDACPLVTQHLAKVKTQLGQLFGKEVFFISISNDPNRDTFDSLSKFALKHQANHPG